MPSAGSLESWLENREKPGKTKGKFKPCAWYNEEGDTLEIYLSPEPRVVERVSSLFSVYVSAGDREKVLGFAIKNIQKHFRESGLSKIAFSTGKATVRLLLSGAMFATEVVLRRQGTRKPKRQEIYSDRIGAILEQAGDTVVSLENLEAVAL